MDKDKAIISILKSILGRLDLTDLKLDRLGKRDWVDDGSDVISELTDLRAEVKTLRDQETVSMESHEMTLERKEHFEHLCSSLQRRIKEMAGTMDFLHNRNATLSRDAERYAKLRYHMNNDVMESIGTLVWREGDTMPNDFDGAVDQLPDLSEEDVRNELSDTEHG
jgi:hypothetical protein